MPEMKEPAAQIMNLAQVFSTSSAPHAKVVYEICSRLQAFNNAVNRRLRAIEASVSGVSAGGSVVVGSGNIAVYEFTLTANLVMAAPSDAAGTLILYVFTQNATGGWTVDWTAAGVFKGFIQPDPTANFLSAMLTYKKSASLVIPAAAFVPGIDVS